ncbi:adenine phosphoribosyltransferase [Jongsikchunia kroppenstedtii]|uniref:adenine phosphoribosyltransferase n=1 Tax=Jongsikchunia kroppenstedtii TaxID=1121721 RepID=UPI000382AB96|nr:adenine phosphoribosyltransferase [Jongsikchunia kroppenstedtii]
MTDQAATEAARAALTRLTRVVADFPSPGVQFQDITPVLADPAGFAAVIDGLAAPHLDADIDLVAGIDARGFLLGGAVAMRLGIGVLAIRKAGKLPPPVLTTEYELEYGRAAVEIPASGLDLHGKRVLVIDDVLATGGTAGAAIDLLIEAGATVVSVGVVLELTMLGGRDRIAARRPAVAVSTLSAE